MLQSNQVHDVFKRLKPSVSNMLHEWSSKRLEQCSLTSVKKLSIALVTLIPEDLLYGTRASGQSHSCVVGVIPSKTKKKKEADPTASVHDLPPERLQDGGQSVGQSVSQCGATAVNFLFVSWVTPQAKSFKKLSALLLEPRLLRALLSASAAAPCVTFVPSVWLGGWLFGQQTCSWSEQARSRWNFGDVHSASHSNRRTIILKLHLRTQHHPPPPPPPRPAAPLSLWLLLLSICGARSWMNQTQGGRMKCHRTIRLRINAQTV